LLHELDIQATKPIIDADGNELGYI
jgi:hypothetical protein